MARHLEQAHQDRSDVAQAVSFPKGSKQRKQHLDYIRNRGNYAYNATVMESGSGELVPFKRPPNKKLMTMHCAYCQALFTRMVLWWHVCNCRLRPGSVPSKPGKNRVQSLCTYTGSVPSNMTKQLLEIISAMTLDAVTSIVKNDQVILDIGQHLLNKGGTSAWNQQYVREKMWKLRRLIDSARRVSTLTKMEDLIDPKHYMETVTAVQFICWYDGETSKFSVPSLANKLGNSLVQISKLLKAQGLISNNKELLSKEWVSRGSSREVEWVELSYSTKEHQGNKMEHAQSHAFHWRCPKIAYTSESYSRWVVQVTLWKLFLKSLGRAGKRVSCPDHSFQLPQRRWGS